jgi:hypothetical protein
MSTLSLLIPTLPERYNLLHRLQKVLLPQVDKYPGRVFVHYHDAGRHLSIGEKRNQLVQQVTTDFHVFIDDDDLVSSQYVDKILWAIDQNPDVVTFNGWMTTDGAQRKNFVIKLGERYEERQNVYYRFPNHLCPMRTSLVRQVRFPHITMQEDYQFAKSVNDRKLLKTSVHIEDFLYHYMFISNKNYAPRTRLR